MNAEKLEEHAHVFRPGDMVKVHSNREVLTSLHHGMSVQNIVQVYVLEIASWSAYIGLCSLLLSSSVCHKHVT